MLSNIIQLLTGHPDTVIRCAGLLLLLGMLFGAVCARLEVPGVITCTFAVAFGATGASFVRFRTERGLWMLAVLFVLMWSAVYGMCILGEIGDVFRNAPVVPLGIFIDYSVATL